MVLVLLLYIKMNIDKIIKNKKIKKRIKLIFFISFNKFLFFSLLFIRFLILIMKDFIDSEYFFIVLLFVIIFLNFISY